MNELIKNKRKCELLAEKVSVMDYGDTITHRELAVMIEEKYPSQNYNSVICRAKKILLNDYSRHLESIRGVGYRITHPDDFSRISVKHINRGIREIKKGENVLTHAPVQDMSEEGRMTYRRVYDRTTILNASMQGAKIEMKMLSKKVHPFSLAEKK